MQNIWNERAKYPATKGDVMLLIQVEARKFAEVNRSFADCVRFCDRMAELRKGLDD